MANVFIIAEAGVNHNGDLGLAKKLIDVAVEAGADAIKFQTFKAECLVTKDASKAKYQQQTTNKAENQYQMLKKLELNRDAHIQLMKYSKCQGITFLSTPFDSVSIAMLAELELDIFKIPSGEITNLPYLREIGRLKKQVILSTGISYLAEVKEALEVLIKAGTCREKITILHANTQYPTSYQDVNLNAMLTIGQKLGVKYGYSDHTLGIEIPIAAVALGATVIEKHLTLDKNLPGPDHQASLEPQQFTAMVTAIRNIQLALGDGCKQPSPSEMANHSIVRKSIVAKCSIIKGEILSTANLTTKRPGTGISPMQWDEVIGTLAKRNYVEDELI